MAKSIRGLALVLVALSILLAACAAANQPDLADTKWALVTLNGTPMDPRARAITIEFDANGQVSGSAGCNSYGGIYMVSNGSITLSQLVSTLMACQDETVMANESAYLQVLNGIASYQVHGNALTLSGGDQSLVFNRQ
jgi:heat shock protein HslJ